jgi:hypothetical protein
MCSVCQSGFESGHNGKPGGPSHLRFQHRQKIYGVHKTKKGTTIIATTVLALVGIVRVRVVLGSEEPDTREVSIKQIRETLHAALADVLASTPHLHTRPDVRVRRRPSRSRSSAALRRTTSRPSPRRLLERGEEYDVQGWRQRNTEGGARAMCEARECARVGHGTAATIEGCLGFLLLWKVDTLVREYVIVSIRYPCIYTLTSPTHRISQSWSMYFGFIFTFFPQHSQTHLCYSLTVL